MDYRQYLSFEQFCEYYPDEEQRKAQSANSNNAKEKQQRRDFIAEQQDNFINFLKQAIVDKGIVAIENSDTHVMRETKMWNQFLQDPEGLDQEQRKMITRDFLVPMIYSLVLPMPDDEPFKQTARYQYDTLIERLNTGNFHADLGDHAILLQEHHCFECGCEMVFSMENWNPILKIKQRNKDTDYYELKNPEPCLMENLNRFTFEIKGTELLVNDWFRFDAFTQATDTNFRFNINNPKGQTDETLHYAREFNFIKITMGNMNVNLFSQNGNIIAGCKNGNKIPKAYDEIGEVSCELWAVTIIEPQILAEIIAKEAKISVDDALDQVKDYVKSGGAEVITVEPGTYEVKFANHYSGFEDLAREDEEIAWKTKAITPYFMIEKALPKNTKKLKM